MSLYSKVCRKGTKGRQYKTRKEMTQQKQVNWNELKKEAIEGLKEGKGLSGQEK